MILLQELELVATAIRDLLRFGILDFWSPRLNGNGALDYLFIYLFRDG